MNLARHLVNPGNLGGCGQGPQDSSHRRHWYFLHSPVGLFEDNDRWLKITEEASLRGTDVEKACYLHGTSAPHNKHEVLYNPGRRASGQNHAQLHVGQVWPTIKQDPSQRIRWPGDNRKPSSQQHEKSQDYGPPGNKTAPCQGTDGGNFHSWNGPWWVGIFKRVVNLMTVLSYEEWMTEVVELEMILSWRPLSYVSFKDPEELH